MSNKTTIQIPKSVREELRKLRKYRRETFSDVLLRLIKKEKEAGARPVRRGNF